MEPEGTIECSLEPANEHSLQPDESSGLHILAPYFYKL
jgi:hypothetical protein